MDQLPGPAAGSCRVSALGLPGGRRRVLSVHGVERGIHELGESLGFNIWWERVQGVIPNVCDLNLS